MATRGFENFTATDAARHALKHAPRPKRSKYGAVKTTTDGIVFDSAKEARRYQELQALVRAGVVTELRRQTSYRLLVNEKEICSYEADFTYMERHGEVLQHVVEDVKSPATRRKDVYRLKKKLMEAIHGLTIREV